MRRYFIATLLLFLSQSGYSQAYRVLSTNTLYAEAGGLGIIYSLNYDKVFNWPSKKAKLDVGIGGCYLRQPTTRYNFYTGQYEHIVDRDKVFMIRSALLFGKSPFLYGIGLEYFHDDKFYTATRVDASWWEPDHTFLSYLHIRYQPQAGGLFYALNFNLPITSSSGAFIDRAGDYSKLANIYLWPGLCIGYTFRSKEARKALKSGT